MDTGAEAAAVRLLLEVKANNNTISPVNGQRVIKASEPGHIAEIAKEDGSIALQSVILYGQTGVRRTKAAQKQRIQRGTQFAVTEQTGQRLPFVVAGEKVEMLKAAIQHKVIVGQAIAYAHQRV